MTLIVNLIAGPGTGKSTTAAGVFYQLKQAGVNCELATEYAKDLVWAGHEATLRNQPYILGKQYNRLWRLLDKVEVVITDCPLIMLLHYGKDQPQSFKDLTVDLFNSMENRNWYLRREKEYNPSGRVQTEDEAKDIDLSLAAILVSQEVTFTTINANDDAASVITQSILEEIR